MKNALQRKSAKAMKPFCMKLAMAFMLTALMLLPTGNLSAQSRTVSGKVTDESGKPMPGVTVLIQDSNLGTTSGGNGDYSIRVPNDEAVISFSFLGYSTYQTVVGTQTQINVTMTESSQAMDDVVVIGYGTARRRDLSGAVASVRSSDLMIGNPTSLTAGLQGKVAGVVINSSDGAPGGGMSITVRGANSFTTSSQPLYVIDGIPYDASGAGMPSSDANTNSRASTNPLDMVNPNDIESIEILKDASATAIYGSRGANGVVLVTTKRGKKGEGRIEYSANFGISKITNPVEVLGAYDYANFVNEGILMSEMFDNRAPGPLTYRGAWSYREVNGSIVTDSGRYYASPEDYLNPGWRTDQYGNKQWIEGTDWMDQIFQNGSSMEHNLSISGGGEKVTYAISGNYTDQKGIILNSGYNRAAVRSNLNAKVTNWLEAGLNVNYSRSVNSFAKTNAHDYSIVRSAMLFPPTIYAGDNATSDEVAWLSANPGTYVRDAKDDMISNATFVSAFAQATIIDGLTLRQNFGYSNTNRDRSTFYGSKTGEGKAMRGRIGRSDSWWNSLTSETILTYDFKLNDRHHFNVMAAGTFEVSNYADKSLDVSDLSTELNGYHDLGVAMATQQPRSTRSPQSKLASTLGRINYILDEKYIFTISGRYDGSSKFYPTMKQAYTFFPSGAFAWRVSEEDFMKNQNVVSNLKLRLSYGKTGNQGISSNIWRPLLSTAHYISAGSTQGGLAIDTNGGPANPNLKWETTDQYNAGLDISLLNNRINFTVDYYFKKTNDLLQNVLLPSSTGYRSRLVNSGHITNEGLELTGMFYIIDNNDFKFDINANISFNRNKIGGLDYDQFAADLWNNAKGVFIQRNGMPMGAIYGFVEDGFYNNEAAVRADPNYRNLSDNEIRAMIGEIRYRNFDDDPEINDSDRRIIGDTNPDFTYGLTTNFSWKGISLSLFFQGMYGNDIFNANLMNITMESIANITKDAYDNRWTPDNYENAKWPRATMTMTRSMKVSDRYVEDGSYLKLKTLTLGYTFNPKWKGVSSIHVYGNINNVFTLTKYSWFDPDVNAFGNDASRRGVDIFSYPASRTFSFGFNLVF